MGTTNRRGSRAVVVGASAGLRTRERSLAIALLVASAIGLVLAVPHAAHGQSRSQQSSSGPAKSQLYKWTDDRGVVHYGDRVPPEYVNRANELLNKQGVTIRQTAAALSPEQVAERDAQKAREREAQKAEAELRRKDLALLYSYATEQEIDVVKARAVKQVEQSISATRADLDKLLKKRAALDVERSGYVKNQPPERLVRETEMTDKEIERQKAAVEARQNELAAVAAKYDADKQRYREAKARQAQLDARVTAATGQAPARRPN